MRNNRSEAETFRFFPYIGMSFVAILFFLGAILMFFLSYILPVFTDKILTATTAIGALLFCWVFSVRIPLRVDLDDKGIQFRNVVTKEQYSADWTDFFAAYCMYGSRGHTYLLLARTEMNCRQQKESWKALQQIKKGHPLLSKEGNVCFLVDRRFSDVRHFVQDRLPFFVPELGPHVG